MDKYFERKKRAGLIFTLKNIDPHEQAFSMRPDTTRPRPIESPAGPSYWSRKSGRYRNAYEQREYIKSGCVDRDLGSSDDIYHGTNYLEGLNEAV